MRPGRSPLILPIVLVVVGVLLLLKNFLLVENLDLLQYWPIVLILAGVQLLIRGDIGFTWQSQTFGITRGSVQTASLEANSGELDVRVRAQRRKARLIASQYTGRSRPNPNARGQHARISMHRSQSRPFSLTAM